MNIYEKSIEVNRKLIAVLERLLKQGQWEASLFLKATSKQINELRQRAEQLLVETIGNAAALNKDDADKQGYKKVYISVYQAEGNNLQKWQQTLKALTEHSISRPIYDDEKQVQAILRNKIDPVREGYVSVYVKEGDIITAGKASTDRIGNELLTLKVGAVKPENIIEFVHYQKSYYFKDEELVFKQELN